MHTTSPESGPEQENKWYRIVPDPSRGFLELSGERRSTVGPNKEADKDDEPAGENPDDQLFDNPEEPGSEE